MIKVFCNICMELANDNGFMFEASIMEKEPTLASTDIGLPIGMKKSVVHVCKSCFNKDLRDLLYGKKN